MKPTPKGWPRISNAIFYENPAAAIDWLCRAFGFEVRLKVEGEGGRIEHSELVYGDGVVMVGTAGGDRPGQESMTSPRSIGDRVTQCMGVFVDDVDAHAARARAEGAVVFRELETQDYGPDYWVDRTYGARDLEGHIWFFMQRLRG